MKTETLFGMATVCRLPNNKIIPAATLKCCGFESRTGQLFVAHTNNNSRFGFCPLIVVIISFRIYIGGIDIITDAIILINEVGENRVQRFRYIVTYRWS